MGNREVVEVVSGRGIVGMWVLGEGAGQASSDERQPLGPSLSQEPVALPDQTTGKCPAVPSRRCRLWAFRLVRRTCDPST